MTKKDVYVLVAFIIGLLLMVSVYRTYGEQIELRWDPVEGVDGYRLYQAIRAQNPETGQVEHSFDYESPITNGTYTDGNIPQDITSFTVDLPGVDGEDTKYMFTARAYRGDETSVNSNEVSYVVSLVPPFPAAELSGGYDKDAGLINISWSQPADEYEWRMVSHWIVYFRLNDEDEWKAIGRIDSNHDLTMTAPFDAVSQDDTAVVQFVIVSYRRSGVYSANSDVLSLEIDRRTVPPIQNLRINIQIPVE